MLDDKIYNDAKSNQVVAQHIPEHRAGAIATWKVEHVSKWLSEEVELPQYAARFEEMSIDGLLVCELTETDLREELHVKVSVICVFL